ncbi:SpoIIE family protein phosphatase [Catellatospora sp. NPDC049609]|uniref:PP2C family protein-serine/threonine phosphatase n=1 Tax=Catellatospora sp. NPDC049609 TaxID=3155505 RepID=UPI00343E0655
MPNRAQDLQPSPADAAADPLAAVDALLGVDPTVDETGTLHGFTSQLLRTLGSAVGAQGCSVWVDHGDGDDHQLLGTYGKPLNRASPARRIPVPVSLPWSAELLLQAPDTPTAHTLTRLAAQRLGLLLEAQRLRESDRRRQTSLAFLAEVSELLAQSLDLTLTLALIPRLVVPRLGTWCTLHRATPGRRLAPAAAAHADEAMSPWLDAITEDLTRTLQAPGTAEALLAGKNVPLPTSLSGIAVPLFARGEWLGVLSIGRDTESPRDPDEIPVAEEVARRCALAVDNARIHEERLTVSHTLQQALLPAKLPMIPGLGIGAEYAPAGRGVEVGGDLYDIMPMPDGRWLVVVGDVSGKGVPAAAVTGLIREVIRVLVKDGRPLPAVLATLNDTLSERSERYCTLALAAFDTRNPGPDVEVTLYLAGHDRPLVLHADGRVSSAGRWGTALGLVAPATCQPARLVLHPGETLVFFTDGVTERRNGQDFFGTNRLAQRLTYLAGHPADVIAARLRTAAVEFSADQPRDDMAIMAVRNDKVA